MASQRNYPRGTEFPSEAFVQRAIERHFRELGFNIEDGGHIDLICAHPTTPERWHIEAKGLTAAVGLDFRTCLGQLIQRMRDRDTSYGIALPDLPQYAAQISIISSWVIDALKIHWLLVSPDGSVKITRPNRSPLSDA